MAGALVTPGSIFAQLMACRLTVPSHHLEQFDLSPKVFFGIHVGAILQEVLMNLILIIYRKTSNISHTLVGNEIVDHSDAVGASPVGAAPTASSLSTWHLASRDSTKKVARQYENLLSVGIWCILYIRDLTVCLVTHIRTTEMGYHIFFNPRNVDIIIFY